jgi:hypothetical protein
MTKKKDVEKKEKVRIYYSKDREIFDDELKQYDGKNPLYKEINPLIQRAIFSSENLCFLMGAGASLVTGDDGKLISGSGQSMAGLWDEIKDKEEFKKISDAFRTAANNNLEDLLSRLESEALHFQLNGDTTESEKIGSQIIFVKEFIKEKCKLKLTPQFPHERFIRNIFLRKQSHSRVKIFTLNYDTLLEQAANEVEAVVVDGFNFSHDSTFSPIVIDSSQ